MNSFGRLYRVSLWGESHGSAVGVTIDGVPCGLPLSVGEFEGDLSRRRSGALGTTTRKEEDIPVILSGEYNGFTTGAPLTILFNNRNIQSSDYDNFVVHPRPGHADFTAWTKYDGFHDHRGGGHFSGRLTLPLVAAGVVAKKVIAQSGIVATAELTELGGERDSTKFDAIIERVTAECDSVGGVVECHVKGVYAGLGEPFFDSIEGVMAHALFAIPAVRGVEFGDGFEASRLNGSEHNDCFIDDMGHTATNRSGGVNGGISNGNNIVFKVAFKPTSTIGMGQMTYDFGAEDIRELKCKGRHDTALVVRTPVIVEAVAAIVLADFCLIDLRY